MSTETLVMCDDGRTVLLTRELPGTNAALTPEYWLGLECALLRSPTLACCETGEEPEPFL